MHKKRPFQIQKFLLPWIPPWRPFFGPRQAPAQTTSQAQNHSEIVPKLAQDGREKLAKQARIPPEEVSGPRVASAQVSRPGGGFRPRKTTQSPTGLSPPLGTRITGRPPRIGPYNGSAKLERDKYFRPSHSLEPYARASHTRGRITESPEDLDRTLIR